MLTYDEILKDPAVIKNYLLREYVNVQCDACGKCLSRQKRHIVRSINNNSSGIYCDNKCKSQNQDDNKKCNVVCLHCNNNFQKHPSNIKKSDNHFCSVICFHEHRNKMNDWGIKTVKCTQCNEPFDRHNGSLKKAERNFCSYSCATVYKNINGDKCKNRSKIELYIENRLIENFPNIEFCFNNRKMIQYELDIYIPIINTAIELNGPHHSKPIHGFKQLNRAIERDIKKQCICELKGIHLHIYDISHIKTYTDVVMEEYYKKIDDLIRPSIAIV